MKEQDPWGPQYKRRVKTYFSMFIGTICVVLGGTLLLLKRASPAEITTFYDVVLGGGIILLGLCAALPQVFMPVIALLIDKIPGGSATISNDILDPLIEELKDERNGME
jgi:hypothetical protein